ncbi:hypothetical protein DPMN_019075 [Dreissena polymorpha]|uniref:Uncharacterized protein n=1 Tax=Dreissena polymorpha TaxID=45954 RepID=A0A9D4S8X9_DREPO|nr:hypothetical protein DPMN_019075 [Dreissena polymorpha]
MLLCFAVYKCAVSPTGDRLYIISWYQNKLLTLARDGTRLATYTDPALHGPSGQVLVCGYLSHTVLQLATLATQERDGHHIINHCGTSGISLLSQDNDAEDVVDKSVQGLNACVLSVSVQGLNARTKCMCVKCGTKCMCVKCGTKCKCVKCGTKCMCVKCGTKCMCYVQGLNAWTKYRCSVQGLNAGTKCRCSVQGLNAGAKCIRARI